MERYDPELSGITPMAIRGSFASIMIQRHLRGELFVDKSEGSFLDFLAKSMNTSREQLGATRMPQPKHKTSMMLQSFQGSSGKKVME